MSINIIELYVEFFPELRDEYEKEIEYSRPEPVLAHVFTGDVIAPHVNSLVKLNSDRNSEQLSAFFDWVDDMLINGTKCEQNVLHVSLLEYLVLSQKGLPCRKYLGPNAQEAVAAIERDMKKPEMI